MNIQKLNHLYSTLLKITESNTDTSPIRGFHPRNLMSYQDMCNAYREVTVAYHSLMADSGQEEFRRHAAVDWSRDLPQYMYSGKHMEGGLNYVRTRLKAQAECLMVLVRKLISAGEDAILDDVLESHYVQAFSGVLKENKEKGAGVVNKIFTPQDLKPFPYPPGRGPALKGFLTKEEALSRARQTFTVITHGWEDEATGQKFYFFSDHHLFGHGILPSSVVPTTSTFYSTLNQMEDLEQLSSFSGKRTQIVTVQELCDKLNASFVKH